MNRQIVLTRRPEGLVTRDDFDVVEAKMPEPAEHEVRVETLYLGLDATVRTWLSKAEGYIPPVEIGEVVRCSGIGRVVESNSDKVPSGALVATLTGWQEHAVVGDDPMLTTVLAADADPLAELSIFGSAGMTAYVGLTDVGKVREGDTVVVSAAAGATGSSAVQIAKILGARVIGVAGSHEKCEWLTNDLGADGAINYRTDDLAGSIKAHCSKGVDVFFDNTGGPILDAVLGRIANGGRVVLCGAISSYNDHHKPPGPANYLNLISRRASMQGFISWDAWGRWSEITGQLRSWQQEGKLRYRVHTFDGLESAPEALNAMFTGENIGKIVVKL
ncbi:MAG TPA: NADP-dependent oxidoreductase [Acidimicrobiales bacterium]|nr:NADP-dependent oxidoreductase [Acidimicrobiales bacterium]